MSIPAFEDSVGTPSLLVDTNVWLDALLPWRMQTEGARTLIRRARQHDCKLLYPVHVVKDVLYLCERSTKQRLREHGGLTEDEASHVYRLAWSCVYRMRSVATAVGCDESDLWLAAKYQDVIGDFEDSLVVCAAVRAGASYLVTNDTRLLKASPVRAVSSVEAVKLMEAGLLLGEG